LARGRTLARFIRRSTGRARSWSFGFLAVKVVDEADGTRTRQTNLNLLDVRLAIEIFVGRVNIPKAIVSENRGLEHTLLHTLCIVYLRMT
jgi:hypothetical protein